MNPTQQTITRTWAEHMEARDHSKAHAFDTPFRYSDAMNCARSLSYKAAGFPESDPMDGPSLAITGMGSLLHEDIQGVQPHHMIREATSQIDGLISGHADIADPENHEVVEIKTVGAYKFDQSIGIVRSPGRGRPAYWKEPKGPSIAHICQGGFNARALGCTKVRIVYVSREAVSVQKAQELNMTPLDRFTAEWVYTEDEWGPIVEAELNRLRVILAKVNYNLLSDRVRPDDKGVEELVSPDKHPLCRYCPYEHACRVDGPGAISFTREQVEESQEMEREYQERTA